MKNLETLSASCFIFLCIPQETSGNLLCKVPAYVVTEGIWTVLRREDIAAVSEGVRRASL